MNVRIYESLWLAQGAAVPIGPDQRDDETGEPYVSPDAYLAAGKNLLRAFGLMLVPLGVRFDVAPGLPARLTVSAKLVHFQSCQEEVMERDYPVDAASRDFPASSACSKSDSLAVARMVRDLLLLQPAKVEKQAKAKPEEPKADRNGHSKRGQLIPLTVPAEQIAAEAKQKEANRLADEAEQARNRAKVAQIEKEEAEVRAKGEEAAKETLAQALTDQQPEPDPVVGLDLDAGKLAKLEPGRTQKRGKRSTKAEIAGRRLALKANIDALDAERLSPDEIDKVNSLHDHAGFMPVEGLARAEGYVSKLLNKQAVPSSSLGATVGTGGDVSLLSPLSLSRLEALTPGGDL